MVARSDLLYKIPAGISSKNASTICIAAHTASDALLNVIGLGFPPADVPGISVSGKGILIWGGASSVGIMATQIARAAGFQYIFVTASTKNHNDMKAGQKPLGIELAIAFDTVGKGTTNHGPPTGPSGPELTRLALSASNPGDLRLACTLPVPADSDFGFCASFRPKGSLNAMGAPQDPNSSGRVRKVMEHLLANDKERLKLPVVTTITGTKAGISGIRRAAEGKMSLEKLGLEHPLD
ncbi:uncharacterized protein FIESC28_06181 [Fusarium coffeatum]|uniref:Alcohol dehydrogenase-like C-terminal domain-containing protein n=1 Tax=Fusarium coffeatum TaxID=231269 RepID=A0A366RP85_9HYPO|nr:uncharacterized protein FIESC28_06181 [Fusarium coffeatum]RBR18115.1 hypothetical protein FIESC28_06181 [Fusarium coffeatum]